LGSPPQTVKLAGTSLGRGVKIDGATIEDPMLKISVKEPFVLQFGKNKFIKIRSDDR
jgi:hypothetical protein